MRPVLAVFAVAGLLLAPSVVAKPSPPPIVWAGILSDVGVGIVTWAPVSDAREYVVYRGQSLDQMQIIGRTSLTAFVDEDAPPFRVIYGVVAVGDKGESPMSSVDVPGEAGGCHIWYYGTSIRTSIEDCLPSV